MIVVIRAWALSPKVGLLALLIVSFKAMSYDLGTLSKVYPIIEKDMREVIQERLKKRDQKEDAQILKKSYERYLKQTPGQKLPKARQYSRRKVDVRFQLGRPILDHKSQVLYAKGTVVNPLLIKSLTKSLYFIDGNDTAQINWALKKSNVKIILVQGDYFTVSKKYQRRFYFDQYGYLVSKLQIKRVPSVVSQQGASLMIEEFNLD